MNRRIIALLLSLTLVLGIHAAAADQRSGLERWLFATANKLEHSSAPGETREDYEQRLGGMSAALARATKPYANGLGWTTTELGLAMLTLWHAETLFDQRVHAGMQHPKWTQDKGRARCLGQIHVSLLVPQSEWERLVGTDEGATQMCADATARIWVAQARQCGVWYGQRADRNKVAKVFAAYASGGNCRPGERDWARADKWLAGIAQRPDRSPVKGYRRAAPAEIPSNVKEDARTLATELAPPGGHKVGAQFPVWGSFLLLVEKHAEGKIGVSVLMKEST